LLTGKSGREAADRVRGHPQYLNTWDVKTAIDSCLHTFFGASGLFGVYLVVDWEDFCSLNHPKDELAGNQTLFGRLGLHFILEFY